ncbi:MAG: peptidoglycan DD-metalloendopeptidase family protein [Chloroflexi bacterium]|nr:peptidoglycan DD-metalloendopeptidase family protein [Chloroflexota bacterium]
MKIEKVTQTVLNVLAVTSLLLIGVIGFDTYRSASASPIESDPLPTPPPAQDYQIPYYNLPSESQINAGLDREVQLHTDLPEAPRDQIRKYVVQQGDTVFGIAEKFGLRPETIFWGNLYILGDNVHAMSPGIEINIMPEDGVLHRWTEGEGLNGVASYYKVTPEDIINYPGNGLSMETIGDYTNPNIAPGTELFVPGGERELISWSAPEISRTNPAVARHLGPGFCGQVMTGAVGNGTFIYPTVSHDISGYNYSPETNHNALDFGGSLGNAIYAVDAGVVVYAGWNDYGYGNMVVIDHGNGFQTLYAHLNTVGVACAQSVYQGDLIGGLGSTGNSSGPHLHFEIRYNGGYVNPWNFLP